MEFLAAVHHHVEGLPLGQLGFFNFADDRWRLVIAEPAP